VPVPVKEFKKSVIGEDMDKSGGTFLAHGVGTAMASP